MKTLFFVTAYSHRLNEWERYIISDVSPAQAQLQVEDGLPPDWKVHYVLSICRTPDDVFRSV